MACRSTGIFRKLKQLSLAAGKKLMVQFTPHLIPINRGILTTLYLEPVAGADAQKIAACYTQAYGNEPFVRLLEGNALPDTKNVAGSNIIEIAWRLDPRTGRLVVMSAEDNLLKAPAGGLCRASTFSAAGRKPPDSFKFVPTTANQPVKWNAADYAANSTVQQTWARELIAKLNLLGDEHMLDVGCGDGKVTAEMFLTPCQKDRLRACDASR